METDSPHKCHGCGATLTVLNRSLDMPGYCGKCAAKAQDEEDLGELPADVGVIETANSDLRPDAIRFTLIALVATVGCFAGALVGAAVSGPTGHDDSALDASIRASNRVVSSLQASWFFGLVAMFVGKLFFLRKGNVLTFARWKMFWGWFIIFYFATYIPLALFLPRTATLPLPADIVTFMLACGVAYAAGIFFVMAKDRTLKAWLCGRCVLPSPMVDAACRDDWDEAQRIIDQTVADSQGLVSANNLLARLYLAVGMEKLRAGDTEAAVDRFKKGCEIDAVSDPVRFKIACAFDDAGNHSDAYDLLSDLITSSKDKDLSKRARKLLKMIRKLNRLDIRCPKCARGLSGTKDMIGDEAVCPKCKTEFVVTEDVVSR